MASRRQSIRSRIILLLTVPIVAMIALWGVTASASVGNAMVLLKARSLQTKLVKPAQALVTGLQAERQLSVSYLGNGRTDADLTALRQQWSTTDALRTTFRRGALSSELDGVQSGVIRKARQVVAQIDQLDTIREAIEAKVLNTSFVIAEYSGLIDGIYTIYDEVSPDNTKIAMSARTLTALARARELFSQEVAGVSAALARGRITEADRRQATELSGEARYQFLTTIPLLDESDQQRYRELYQSSAYALFTQYENEVLDAPVGGGRGVKAPIAPDVWTGTAGVLDTQLFTYENIELADVTNKAQDIAVGVLVRLGLTAGLGLLALLVSVLVAVRIGRRIIREARTLAGAVEVFSRDQLPVLAERVRKGELIEPDETIVVEPGTFRIAEIDKLSTAFDVARGSVVEAARSEAAARNGVSELFINLARRNQALLHRQLGLLDTMERRTEDPSELADLFRLDHLATCMRRHAEGLVTLAGKPAGRTWRKPVPIVDVARGAVAEVDDYTRVQVRQMPKVALSGVAVADTIHLLAELIENAIMFSPPDTPVVVRARPAGGGLTVEVEDRGLGMTAELLSELNSRLAVAAEFDLFDSARLGTFVVSRLAARHDVKVSLRAAPYGGTTATVFLPAALIMAEPPARVPDEIPAGAGVVASAPDFRTSAPVDLADTHAGLPRRRRGRGAHAAPEGQAAPRASGGGFLPAPVAQEPEPASAEPAAPEPAVSEPAVSEPAVSEPAVSAPVAGEHLGLPRRRRQASLAPQLRGGGEGPSDAAESPHQNGTPGHEATQRSPEELRSMMSAMQRGWQRGRDTSELPAVQPEEDTP
jgi:signal transduction histidine kinase